MGKYTITRNVHICDEKILTITIKVESVKDMPVAIQKARRWMDEWDQNTPKIMAEKGEIKEDK